METATQDNLAVRAAHREHARTVRSAGKEAGEEIGVRDDLTKLDEILAQEFSEEFVNGMRNRIIHGYMRYGPASYNATTVDLPKAAKDRIEKYLETGNTEWLVDAANMVMLEFMYPQHRGAHFHADGDESEEHPRATYAARTYRNSRPTRGQGRRWFYRYEGG